MNEVLRLAPNRFVSPDVYRGSLRVMMADHSSTNFVHPSVAVRIWNRMYPIASAYSYLQNLTTPRCRTAAHAFVATAVADHDRAADVATGSVSEVDDFGEGVGGVNLARGS